MYPDRIVSGMLPTHGLHLGHYFSRLQTWIKLQAEMPSLFFVADWHALTVGGQDAQAVEKYTWDLVLDWLAAGVDPGQATLFVQSRVPEHAELYLLLSLATPVAWLEKLPQIREMPPCNLAQFGNPVLQAADVLLYRASQVALVAGQASELYFMREVAAHFNQLYGKEKDFEEKAQQAVKKLGSKRAKMYMELRAEFQGQGSEEALEQAKAMLEETQNLSMIDRERLFGYLEGSSKLILVEPEGLMMPAMDFPGLDGQQMRTAAGNTIALREEKTMVERKIRQMPVDPGRSPEGGVGNPERCPVWSLHLHFSNQASREALRYGCSSGGMPCGDCKQALCVAVVQWQEPLHERAQQYLDDPSLVRAIIADGCDNARKLAQETMRDVREAFGIA